MDKSAVDIGPHESAVCAHRGVASRPRLRGRPHGGGSLHDRDAVAKCRIGCCRVHISAQEELVLPRFWVDHAGRAAPLAGP